MLCICYTYLDTTSECQMLISINKIFINNELIIIKVDSINQETNRLCYCLDQCSTIEVSGTMEIALSVISSRHYLMRLLSILNVAQETEELNFI